MLKIQILSSESADLEAVKQLFHLYALELNENICFQNFDEELSDPLKKYGGENGLLLTGKWNNELAGCVAYTRLNIPGTCEMKRLFVLPAFRGEGVGKELAEAIIEHARKDGFKSMVLDTLEKLGSAVKLYEKLGFKERTAYYNNPLNGVIYMEKPLNY
ncbi:GNAT family N-acetyltransferase [Gynurincola endophyticus]|jgi:putative acetyltransferase|uniref:GNAT family N-acetyltransferase n=1 Tax=Gynurincola endophyticus TaxID=2479004 RepID=UPI001315A082|nr:GNAT family N-acetyltransferase [Gynurincola endophyticus]